MEKFDLIIIGGGFSGTIAAISAARNGIKTLLVESAGFPGGSLTVNSVAPMMSFHSGKEQVSKGITQELINRLIDKNKSIGHVEDSNKFTATYTPFDQEAMKFELETMLLESGVKVLYHSYFATVTMDGDKINYVTVCNKNGLMNLKAKIYIDATGDADLVFSSGNPYMKGRPHDGKAQPMTLMVKFSNVDTGKMKEYIRTHKESFPGIEDFDGILSAPVLSSSGFVKEFKEAKEKGEISIPREDVLFFESNNKGEFFFNTTRIVDHDSSDAWSFSEAETIGRKQAQDLDKFVKKYIPGFENSWMVSTGPTIGSRSSRQLLGRYILTEQDVLAETIFDDAIAFSGYPIDVHSPDGEGTKHEKLRWGGIYSIPYGSVLPMTTKNLLVTGRCISATFEAQAAIRTTPTVGAIGEAVGIAASIAILKDISVQDVDAKLIQMKLKEQGAYMPIIFKKGEIYDEVLCGD